MTETMQQIGSKAVAEAFGRGSVPAGSRVLGSGCYRTAYLHPDGFVYKVSRGNIGQSMREARRAESMSEILAGLQANGEFTDWEIANCVLYMVGPEESTPVICMEYHEGEQEHSPAPCKEFWNYVDDMATHNVLVEIGTIKCEQCSAYLAHREITRQVYAFADAIEYYDMHPGNYVKRHSDGKRVLIDCG